MSQDQLLFLIPIVAIVMGVGKGMLKKVLEHRVEMARIQSQHQSGGELNLRAELDALRKEIASLRETSTDYDLSLQHVLENVDQRVSNLEMRLRTANPSSNAQDQTIQTGR